MSIQIIDNFELNSSKPIDNRFVVGPNSFYVNRDDIPWKYAGMRIWDLNDGPNGTPYVWTGTTYSSENTVTLGGFGTPNYLARFIAATTLGNSLIYDNGLYVGINNPSPTYTLDVGGSIRTSVYFYGDGTYITSVNATNITQGTLTLNRIQNSASPGFFLTSGIGGTGQVTWVNPTTLNVGSATQLANTRTFWGQPFNGTQNVTGNIDVEGNVSNVRVLKFKNVNDGILNVLYSSTSNVTRSVSFPNMNGNRTVALLENPQTFTAFNHFTDNFQVTGTSSFGDEFSVRIIRNVTIGPPPSPSIPLPVTVLTATYSGVRIGPASTGSARIFNNGRYSWFLDEDTYMYRPSNNEIGFKTNDQNRLLITNSGISMLSPTYSTFVISGVDSIARFVTNTTTAAYTTLPSVPTHFASQPYDRIMYMSINACAVVVSYSSDINDKSVRLAVAASDSGSDGGESSSVIIPANVNVYIMVFGGNGSSTFKVHFMISKIGLN